MSPTRLPAGHGSGPIRPTAQRLRVRLLLAGAALSALAACNNPQGLDWDLRGLGKGNTLDTSEAARQASASRPEPDGRGVISYPNYQVAVARRGDTVATVAERVGLPANELAQYNAMAANAPLRDGEVLALPRRVSEPMGGTAIADGGTIGSGPINVTTLASGAIERAESNRGTSATAAPQTAAPAGREPVRHRIARGETAYSVARLYNVSPKSLADWNGLGTDMAVREGQYLMIPVAAAGAAAPIPATAITTTPGTGSPTPVPPSAAQPLPAEKPKTAAQTAAAKPASPNLGRQATAASSARLAMPVDGQIIRPYEKRKNEGIDIGAAAGSTVRAAADGTVAAITQDTDQVPILVVRHANNLLTVYANIDGIKVAKGAAVTRGQPIATVRGGSPSFMHFEVRQGYDSVDPMEYLK